MDNLFGIDNRDPFFTASPPAMGEEFAKKYFKSIISFAPLVRTALIKDLTRDMKNQNLTLADIPAHLLFDLEDTSSDDFLFYFLIEKIQTFYTLKDLASFCIKVCKPYKYPPISVFGEDYDDPTIEATYIFVKELFEENELDTATADYLLLQYAYAKSLRISPVNMIDILNDLPSIKNGEDTFDISKKIVNLFQSKKHNLFASETKDDLIKIGSNDFIYAFYNSDAPKITKESPLYFSSIYDFIISYGLFTATKANNIFLNMRNLEDDFGLRFHHFLKVDGTATQYLRPTNIKHFLKSFFPKHIDFSKQDYLFNAINNYLIERVTNVNLANKVYMAELKTFEVQTNWWTKYTFAGHISPLVDYPLPIFRSNLVQSIHDNLENQYMESGEIIRIIFQHNYIFFPLIRRLFNFFISLMEITPNICMNDFSNKDFSPLFDINSHVPIVGLFPSINSNNERDLYAIIQNTLACHYAADLKLFRTYNFIQDNISLDQQYYVDYFASIFHYRVDKLKGLLD